MLRPSRAFVSISGDERAGVVDRRVHAVRRVRRLRLASRRRAASSSSGLNAPCLASHSATPASPSRTTRARRAASVIHAETLMPSAAAAATMPACTSGSTVMAIFGEGFPRGITKLYSMSRRLTAEVGCRQMPRLSHFHPYNPGACAETMRWSQKSLRVRVGSVEVPWVTGLRQSE